MVNAVGSTTFANPAYTKNSSAGLASQLAKFQTQLSDCVNCATSKTPEGKEKIKEISEKIASVKQKMDAANQKKSAANGNENQAVNTDQAVAAQADKSAANKSKSISAVASSGQFVDEYA